MLRAVLEANPGLRNHPEVLWRAVELLNPILNSESKNEISMMRQENQTLRDQMQTEAKQRQLEEKRREFDKTFTQKQQFHDDTIAEHARKAAALADKVRGESDLKMRKFYLEQYKAELKAADTESMIKRREEMTKLGYSDQDIKRDYHQHQYSNWAQERAESEQRLDIARQNMTTAKDKSEWERQKADYDAYKNELAARQRELEDLIKESGVIGIDPKVRDEYLRQADDIRKKLAEDPPVMPQFGAPTGPSVPPAATRPTPPTAKPSGITDEESAWAKSKLADKSASAEEIKSILRARHPGMSDQDLEAAISGQPGR
jgi:glutamate synthase domain-containing protein 2